MRVRMLQGNNSLNQTKDTEIKWTIDAASTQARPKWGNAKLMNGFAGSGMGRWYIIQTYSFYRDSSTAYIYSDGGW
jgi:hypothetical protein